MGTCTELTLEPGDSLTVTDATGHELLVVDFDLDAGGSLMTINVYDTDGRAICGLSVDYLGAGYPQCGAPGEAHFINQVVRSTLPRRDPETLKIVGRSMRAQSERREFDPRDPQHQRWCDVGGESEAGDG